MPSELPDPTFTAFSEYRRVAHGERGAVAAFLRETPPAGPVLVFNDRTGEPVDLDLRAGSGSSPDSAAAPAPAPSTGPATAPSTSRSAAPAEAAPGPRGVGRPRLGVVAREVTLLPRHWDWLSRQPGGASVALRKLVDEARRVHADRDTARASREVAYRVMSAIAGNLPGFEEAARALFAGERGRFLALVDPWPGDLGAHLRALAEPSWSEAA